MPAIPFQNFAFTDPVAAQQAVTMAQVLSAAQAEKDRNMAHYAQEIARQNTARENAAMQRAMSMGQMNQQMREAELNRRARADETNRVLASQEKVAGINLAGKNDYRSENEKFNSLAALIDSEDPPTDSEFAALAGDLAPDRNLVLKNALANRRRALGQVAEQAQQVADFWNSKFDDVKVGEDAKFKALKTEFSKDRTANQLLTRDPHYTFRFLPKYKGPRLDPSPISESPPGGMLGPPAPPLRITPIQDLLPPRPPVSAPAIPQPVSPAVGSDMIQPTPWRWPSLQLGY
jgi:hypothetical protein